MMKQRAFVRMPSGLHLDLLNPRPNDFTDDDLAMRLSRTYRWGGESVWANPLSVAQHCVLVLQLAQIEAGGSLTATEQLMILLHDAEEGLLGFDCIAPLKPVLGEAFADVAGRLTDAVWERYSLPEWSDNLHRLAKRCDYVSAASEAFHCTGWSVEEIRDLLGISNDILEDDPLMALHGLQAWEPWTPEVSARIYSGMLAALILRHKAMLGQAQ